MEFYFDHYYVGSIFNEDPLRQGSALYLNHLLIRYGLIFICTRIHGGVSMKVKVLVEFRKEVIP